MSLYEFAQLFALCGMTLFLLSAWILLQISVGPRHLPRASAMLHKEYRHTLIQDLNDKKIVAGGPLGLLIIMAKIGIVSLVIGGLLWLLNWAIN
jgi:hypothetical protein